MRILSTDQVNFLTETLVNEIPIITLRYISQFPRASEGAIIAAVLGQIPGNADAERIRELCIASLHWFLRNGDITMSGTRRYAAVPPYAIASTLVEMEMRLKLCGNRWEDKAIAALTDRNGAEFEVLPARSPNGDEIGIVRILKVGANRLDETVAYLKTIGIPTISIEELQTRLPSLKQLLVPPDEAYRSISPSWGLWDQYDPKRQGGDRWKPQSEWIATSNALLRWRPGEDWRGEQSARYFLHAGQAKLAEVARERAELWMLLLDSRADNSRKFWLSGNMIWVPSMLPLAYHQWLQLLSENWVSEEPCTRYSLCSDLGDVTKIVRENLALVLIRSIPHRICGV